LPKIRSLRSSSGSLLGGSGGGAAALMKGGSCRSTDQSCRRDPPRLPTLAQITCFPEFPTPPGGLKLPSDLLSMPEAENRLQRNGVVALLVANLPPDVEKLWLWLGPLQINLLRDARRKVQLQCSRSGSCAEPITTNRR
jgi:hypothetical protein